VRCCACHALVFTGPSPHPPPAPLIPPPPPLHTLPSHRPPPAALIAAEQQDVDAFQEVPFYFMEICCLLFESAKDAFGDDFFKVRPWGVRGCVDGWMGGCMGEFST